MMNGKNSIVVVTAAVLLMAACDGNEPTPRTSASASTPVPMSTPSPTSSDCDPACPRYTLTDAQNYELKSYCAESPNGVHWQAPCAHAVTVCKNEHGAGGYQCSAAQPYLAMAVCSRHTSEPPVNPGSLVVSCMVH